MNVAGKDFPRLLQEFFLSRLIEQRAASKQTIASYRDAFELLLRFVEKRTGHPSSALTISDLDAPCILDFLDYLEQERGNCARTRNARLTAIRSFMRYVALRDPTALAVAQRVLAIPVKRFDRPVLGFLTREEIQALLDALDRSTWTGQRDYVLIATLYNSGARVSEMVALRVADVLIERRASLLLHGKGRKERVVPLWPRTAQLIQKWLSRMSTCAESPVFPNRAGRALTRSGIRQRLQRAVTQAATSCPSLFGRRISPHTLRHTTAMHLLQSGVDLSVIAMLLGHNDITTTHRYLEADLTMKEAALRRLAEPTKDDVRYHASKRVLAFLDGL